MATGSLENIGQGIRLLNIKEELESEIEKATVYIPNGKESYFLDRIEAYINETTSKGNPKNNDLISSIEDIKLALLDSFWIGDKSDMPTDTPCWCEVWLRFNATKDNEETEENMNNSITDLKDSCEKLEIELDEHQIVFPERIVKLIYANQEQLNQLISACDYIAEFRRSPEEVSFFDELPGDEQTDWIEELVSRTSFEIGDVTVCLLDTGVNGAHPLIQPTITNGNVIQSVDESWGNDDHSGHGTGMAGVALFHDLSKALACKEQVTVNHGLESVKILPPSGNNSQVLYGAITENAVFLAEIENSSATRVISMAVTSNEYNKKDGSPTSWSAAVDSIVARSEENPEGRLFIVSGGNVQPVAFDNGSYPGINQISAVENPGQSWNALTVGAYSNNIRIVSQSYHGFEPMADVGELSPYSSTSLTFGKKWPIKPEILLDGGNMVTNGVDYSECEDLALLTTGKDILNKPLSTIWGTSSATAQASWMAAQIFHEYPGIWPETVRGLLIHSASWTDKMKQQFCQEDTKTKGRRQLLRTCGYGIPDLNKAKECADNAVNLIVESELQPFIKGSMNEMHFHTLPWPKEILKSLGEVDTKLKVTLSYFIEPGPGEIGWKDKYRYPSCGLRFDVINSNESFEDFEKRINVKMRGNDRSDSGDGSSRDWYLGKKNRDVGSVHSDFCVTTAIDLCDANYIAVYPIIGWWRERGYLGRYNEKIKYSLIVSLETPEVESDIYEAITTQIEIEQSTEITEITEIELKH